MPTVHILRNVLIGLAVTLLFCALKSYIIFFINGTYWCQYLCPTVFRWETITTIPVLEYLFQAQEWLLSSSQEWVNRIIIDERKLFGLLIAAPVIEEVIYRGPMYLSKNFSSRPAWWFFGAALAIIFSLSHEQYGIALLPLLVMGLYNLWLVSSTRRLWPAILLHSLFNFVISSYSIYPSIWFGD